MNQYETFKGKLKLFRLKSEISGFFLPITGKEVTQHLTIRNDGRVWLTRYGFCYPVYPRYEKRKSEYYRISKESVDLIFELITTYFTNNYDPQFACDVGVWDAELINIDNKSFHYSGDLIGEYILNDVDICMLIRDELKLPDLFLFDGNAREEFVSTIEAIFNIKNNIEKLYLDYEKCELGLSFENSEENTNLTIKSPNKIKNFLEEYKFSEWYYLPEDSSNTRNRRYQITITSNKGNVIKHEGSYDAIGLPNCWSDLVSFIKSITTILDFNFVKPQIYKKVYPKEYEIIYCSVSFGSSLITYYYICDYDDVDEEDYVLVPVGDDNREKIGIVKKIEFFNKYDAPFPVEKTKHIISIYKEDDMILPKDKL